MKAYVPQKVSHEETQKAYKHVIDSHSTCCALNQYMHTQKGCLMPGIVRRKKGFKTLNWQQVERLKIIGFLSILATCCFQRRKHNYLSVLFSVTSYFNVTLKENIVTNLKNNMTNLALKIPLSLQGLRSLQESHLHIHPAPSHSFTYIPYSSILL